MNPDGMVALLNYRADGTTRECSCSSFDCSSHDAILSILHLLEGRCQGDEALDILYISFRPWVLDCLFVSLLF